MSVQATTTKDITDQFGSIREWRPVLAGVQQRLLEAREGVFCYPVQPPTRCPGAPLQQELSEGTTFSGSLELSVGSQGVTIGFEHTAESKKSWMLGPCDTDAPVLCYPGRVLVWEKMLTFLTFGWFGGYRWLSAETDFQAPSFHLNVVQNDPACGCSGQIGSALTIPAPGGIPDGNRALATTTISGLAIAAASDIGPLAEGAPTLERALLTRGVDGATADELYVTAADGRTSMVDRSGCERRPAVSIVALGQAPSIDRRGSLILGAPPVPPLTILAIATRTPGLTARLALGEPAPLAATVVDGQRLSVLFGTVDTDLVLGDGVVHAELVDQDDCVVVSSRARFAIAKPGAVTTGS
jgi:hypothetical protein